MWQACLDRSHPHANFVDTSSSCTSRVTDDPCNKHKWQLAARSEHQAAAQRVRAKVIIPTQIEPWHPTALPNWYPRLSDCNISWPPSLLFLRRRWAAAVYQNAWNDATPAKTHSFSIVACSPWSEWAIRARNGNGVAKVKIAKSHLETRIKRQQKTSTMWQSLLSDSWSGSE